MIETAVRVDKLSKQYRIGARQGRYGTLRDQIVLNLKSLFGRNGYSGTSGTNRSDVSEGGDHTPATLWALNDVSFEVKQGEVLGIIGRNGAGKSTLLKLLSRITEPTSGRIEINGRVSSLLEVGTGFHGELTGRENVYLNGTILGMKRGEIAKKFDEIVAFAGVEQFIDTPVKHYSSGMYLRLAFAVAAHLEPEILIVDEVLAVGDADFQRKCLGKMAGVADQGRTIFFVSHNMPAITRLCKRVLYMDEGRLRLDGSAHEVVKSYLHSELGTMASREWPQLGKAPKGEIARLCAVRVRTDDGICTDKIDIRKPVGIEIEYEVLKPGFKLRSSIGVNNEEGVHVFEAIENNPDWRLRMRDPGRYRVTAWIPGNFLAEGTMIVDVGLGTVQPNILQFIVRQAVAFHVVDSVDGDSARGDYAGPMPGVVRPLLKWDTVLDSNYADERG
jgi:lipopolysaccharide transport system ATP-binding protein